MDSSRNIYLTKKSCLPTLQPVKWLTVVGLLLPLLTLAQDIDDKKPGFFANWTIKPVAAAQFWGSYTEGARVYRTDSMTLEEVDGRLNFVLRRTRLGAIIKPSDNVTLNLVGTMDNIGRDVLAGPTGGVNNGAFPNVGVWNAFVQWRLIDKKELIHLIVGYHSPHFSRESSTGWHAVNSMDKSFSQFYIRRHLVAKNPGRSVGISVGGLALSEESKLGLQYTAGIFNSTFTTSIANSAGQFSAPLLTGRLVLLYGDPESTNYKLGYRFNTLSKRRGISIGASGSYEGKNDLFESNYAFSVDVLFNYGPFNVGGEWAWLRRDGLMTDGNSSVAFTAGSQTGFARASYNIPVANEQILEFGVTYMYFGGATDDDKIDEALAVGTSAGKNTAFDIAAIWHFIPGHIKAEVHAVFQDGKLGEAGQGAVINDFFTQSGVAIQRGDYVGVSLIFAL